MKKLFLITLLVVFIPATANAGKFEGLKPGVSTKLDADAKLGQPIREVIEDVRYDYDPEEHDARRLSLEFKGEAQIIKTINVYFIRRRDREKVKGWFGLKSPAKKEIDDDGNLVEYYMPKAIAFHYDGPEKNSPIKYLTYFDKAMLSSAQEFFNVTDDEDGGRQLGVDEVAFLGVEVIAQGDGVKVVNVLLNSPARRAGLKKGDVIKGVENYDFEDDPVDSAAFSEIVSEMPVEKPLLFTVARGNLDLEINIALEAVDAGKIEARAIKNRKKAKEFYKKAVEFRARGQWMKTINNLKQAMQLAPDEEQYSSDLARAYYKIGEDEKAVEVMEHAVRLAPNYDTYFKMGRIYIDQKEYDKALKSFKKAERLRSKKVDPVEIYTWLGAAYFHKGDVDEAVGYSLKAYRKSRKKSALAAFYLGACFDKKGNARDAISYYNRFIKLKSKDEKREVLARSRVKELRNSPEYKARKEKMRRGWMSAFGAMAEEISGQGSAGSGGYRKEPSGYSPDPNPQGSDTDWDAVFDGARQQDTSQYDDVFTMPEK